jgi:hypothetical protein
MAASIEASWSSPSIASRPVERLHHAPCRKATSGWNEPIWCKRHRRRKDLGTERTAGVDHRLAAVHPERSGERGERVVGDGQDDEFDLIEDRLRIGEDPRDIDERAEPLPSARVATRDGVDGPARTRQGDAQRGPDRARPDDPDDRWLARSGMCVRMDVVARVGLVAVPVETGWQRVEIDACRLDRGFDLRAVTLRIVAGQVSPGLHRRRPEVSVEVRRSCTPRV